MFARLNAWLAARRKAKYNRRFQQGYAWAMDQLHQANSTCEQLHDWAHYGLTMDGENPWDRGIIKACYNWEASTIALEEILP